MAGSIAAFKASFSTELARPSRFDVFIPRPTGLVIPPNDPDPKQDSKIQEDYRSLCFRCESADLPGRALATTTQKIYGPEEKFPYQTTYNDINITFICSDGMKEKLIFDQWLNLVNPRDSYNFNYKALYTSDIRIVQYDVGNFISYQVDLLKAFPIGVNDLQLDWSSDGYHKLTVTFSYKEWKYVPPPPNTGVIFIPKLPNTDFNFPF
jgi:hypothetical protein